MFSQRWNDFLKKEIDLIKESGRFKEETIIGTPQRVDVVIFKDGVHRHCLNFCANNYLGLANNKKLQSIARRTIKMWGYGMASVRFICGTQKIHKDLEREIAYFFGTEDAIIYTSCFDANAGLFEALMKSEKNPDSDFERMAIISDQLNHASIIDGVRSTKVEKRRYLHSNMGDLEKHLQETRDKLKIIATDGVFSMDGEIANLKEICELAGKYDALVMVDDSHATGVLGKNGKGSIEHCEVLGKVDIITSTFGKALGGGIGGFTAGPKEIIEIMRQRSRPYLFSNSLLPAACGAAIESLEIIKKNSKLREKLMKNTLYFREKIKSCGFEIKGGIHPIVPVMIRDSKLAQEMSGLLIKKGILAVAFSYPVVPKNGDRIRVQISAAHTKKHLDTALKAFYEAGKELKLI